MKTLFKNIRAIALFVLVCGSASAQLQVVVTNGQNKITEYSIPSTLAASAVTNFSTNVPPFLINPGYGVGVEASWTNAGSGAVSNVAFYVLVTVDGSNYATAPLSYLIKTSNGSTAVRAYTNFPSTIFDSAFGVSLLVSNGDSANVIGFTDRKVRLTRAKIPVSNR